MTFMKPTVVIRPSARETCLPDEECVHMNYYSCDCLYVLHGAGTLCTKCI